MQKPEGLILDFDGVFYKYDRNFNHVCGNAAALAAKKHGVPDSHEDLLAAFLRVGDPHSFKLEWQLKHNFDWLAYHHTYHDGIDVLAV